LNEVRVRERVGTVDEQRGTETGPAGDLLDGRIEHRDRSGAPRGGGPVAELAGIVVAPALDAAAG